MMGKKTMKTKWTIWKAPKKIEQVEEQDTTMVYTDCEVGEKCNHCGCTPCEGILYSKNAVDWCKKFKLLSFTSRFYNSLEAFRCERRKDLKLTEAS